MTAEEGLAEVDAAMLRFAATGDAATLIDEIADVLTRCRGGLATEGDGA